MAKITFKDLQKLAEQKPEEIHPDEAMRRLGSAFSKLRECKDGKSFFSEMENIFCRVKNEDSRDVSLHTIIGICQLAHHIRDEVSPSRRKSFKRILPWLIQLRNKIQEKSPESIVEFVLQKFEELSRPAPSRVRPESMIPSRMDLDGFY